ncbi:MAG: glucose-6-phosphate dehydrogenase [Hyphomicrobiales bacterium]|nr:glucose-6-phosphate dehydrogenase [Hyphomicrobiales bacterium]
MVSRTIETPPFDLIVFGGTGDLAARKLMPALYHRDQAGQIPADARIIGASRRAMSSEDYVNFVRHALKTFVAADDLTPELEAKFLARISYHAVDAGSAAGWPELAAALADKEDRVRAFYLAVGPDLFKPICEHIAAFKLVTPLARVVVEKPLGHDGASAFEVNEAISKVFAEPQVFRIDHYLGKETVQNLMALRFANRLLEPVWNAMHIDHIQITVAEDLGAGERAGYYDTSGALRDMVQNHMLQLLCLVAMEPPDRFNADEVRDEKLKILKGLVPITPTTSPLVTVRGQYKAGASAGGAVPGYLDELAVAHGTPKGTAESDTETFVAIKAEIANWRWAGVPFYLRTGKRLADRKSEIIVTFRPISHSIFSENAGQIHPNRLVIRLQPDEGVTLLTMIKDPGPGGMRLRQIPLDMTFAGTFGGRNPDAYERLLMDVMRGDQTLFMRRDELAAAWRWIDPILSAWATNHEAPKPYTAGSWGPSASIALIERDGRTWFEDVQ